MHAVRFPFSGPMSAFNGIGRAGQMPGAAIVDQRQKKFGMTSSTMPRRISISRTSSP